MNYRPVIYLGETNVTDMIGKARFDNILNKWYFINDYNECFECHHLEIAFI